MRNTTYNRSAAVAYAKKWALERNPKYYDFEHIGGDCTNFISQCLFAGSGVMNYTQITGWYYKSINDRSPSWSSVEYLFRFLTTNKTAGPTAKITTQETIFPGDLIQLGVQNGRFYHTLIVTEITPEILVCAHSYDALDRPLSSYEYEVCRYLHISNIIK